MSTDRESEGLPLKGEWVVRKLMKSVSPRAWKPRAGVLEAGKLLAGRESAGGRGETRWVGSGLHLPGGAAHPHALHWGFLCPAGEGPLWVLMCQVCPRPLGPEPGHPTSELQRIRA